MIKKIEALLGKVCQDILLSESENTIHYKHKDIVTEKDLLAEREIIKGIKAIRPYDCFISEEENHGELTDAPTWIIDPIDGTLNYTRSIPQFGIQVAYYIQKEPVFSAIYIPNEALFIHAELHKGLFVNHKPTRYESFNLNQSIVTFGDFSCSQPLSRPLQLEMMTAYIDEVMKCRIYGASSTDFSYVLLGRTQAHVIFTKRIWELAPGLFMAKEAGLSVLTISKGLVTGAIIGQKKIVDELMICYPIEKSPYFK